MLTRCSVQSFLNHDSKKTQIENIYSTIWEMAALIGYLRGLRNCS